MGKATGVLPGGQHGAARRALRSCAGIREAARKAGMERMVTSWVVAAFAVIGHQPNRKGSRIISSPTGSGRQRQEESRVHFPSFAHCFMRAMFCSTLAFPLPT